jgi:hypothetical protein
MAIKVTSASAYRPPDKSIIAQLYIQMLLGAFRAGTAAELCTYAETQASSGHGIANVLLAPVFIPTIVYRYLLTYCLV